MNGMNGVEIPRLWKAPEVAEATTEPLWRIYQLAREGHLPVVRLGRSMRFDPRAVSAWLAAGGTASDGGG